ncbi:uncharacterized protein PFL1_02394 [Pseudozyma flocculosa PF-1]|uniref:DNA repair protein RAD50 n=1 Tax=Pseudozyma flocculosa TaxID=84751 RepID=A0A5C3F5X1_9BASI|nr:uncharacterized protein PFL1_02394 [Pseudozyma flocculosa PF-1]EPQ30278.1 hypothetical protein PFL1_02394 [Pseudozyma flocculosa PF-1]SPO39782.1 probable RAD50 - DNA repair protein [Pseudozyma flocculosa]
MASLDKLAIRGVRSFDDKSINIIQFFQPLTVIVGYNGSGKTTIIECLKYATTGDLPPNTKGGAFVHDPQMAVTNEVKAQVRLRFYNANRVRMNCVRNLQVSKKKTGGLTMKTLEGLLQIADDDAKSGKRGVISTKCSELDEEIPRLLGVSRSILENVIFCHQEDSNWPLAEPASLKKKFDDIFEATRYTKALDNIKSLRKERTVQLKVDNAALEGLKTDKDRADAIKTKLHALQSQLADKEARLDDLNDEIRIKTVQNSKFYDEATKFREIVSRAETLEERERLHKENMAALEATMTLIDDSDAELQKRKDSFRNHLDTKRSRADGFRRRIAEKRDELETLDDQHGRKLSEKGGLEAERRAHEQAIRRREASIKKMSGELGIKGFAADGLNDAQIREFHERLQQETRQLEAEYAKVRADNSRRDDELSTAWQNLRTEMRAKQNARDQLAESIKRTKDRLKRCQDELEAVDVTEIDVAAAERERDDLSARAAASQKEFEEARFDDKIRKKNQEIREKDDLREERTSEMNILNRHAEVRATLGMKTQEIANRRTTAQSLVDRNAASFAKRVGGTAKGETFERDATKAVAAKERELAEAEAVDQEKNKALQQLESTLTFSRNQLKEKRDTVAALDREIKAILEPDFDSAAEAVKVAAEEIDAAKDDLSSVDSLDAFLKRVVREAKTKGHCLACNRSVSSAEFAAIEKHVTSTLATSDTQKKKAALEEHIREWTQRSAECQVALTKETQMQAIQKGDMVALEKKVAEAEEGIKAASAAAERSTAAVDAVKAELRDLQALKRVGADITRLLSEAEAFEREVEMLQTDLASTGSIQTSEQLQGEIDNLAASIKTLKRELNALQQDRETKRGVIASLERDLHRAEMHVVNKRQACSKKEALDKRHEELAAELEERQRGIRKLDDEVEAAGAPIRRAKDELEQFKAESSAAEGRAKAQIERLQSAHHQLTELDTAVQAYTAQRGPQRLKDCEETIADLALQMQGIQREIKEIEAQVAELEKEMNQSKATERNILDNLRYRQLQKDIVAIEAEIDSLDLEQAQRSRKHFADKYNEAKEEENRMNGEASHLSGEIASLRAQIQGREVELRDDYRGVHAKYKQKLIEVKTSDLANSDLEKYAKALESAIMRYHSIKMEEINEILRYLWQKTYQGTDIDTILIKADNEGVRGNRSYNYRVCMVKDTVEMDMRGRCSAGQKVLASIIIRLALADSFGSNCGILALDEPTTNLDRENIEALARSLADLIKERQGHGQLQLVVITHDEDFLTLLGQSDVLEYYWRVSRDINQKSIIEKERIRSS